MPSCCGTLDVGHGAIQNAYCLVPRPQRAFCCWQYSIASDKSWPGGCLETRLPFSILVSWNGLRYGCVFVCKAVSFICQYSQRKFKVCVTWKLHPRETVSRDMLKACFGRQESCFLVGVLLVFAYFLYGRTYFWKKVKGVNCRCKHVRLPKCFRVMLRPTWQPIGTCVSEQT